jgi:hypothetical protein
MKQATKESKRRMKTMNTVTYETYPDMFTDYEELIENENYDNEIREFTVPEAWATEWMLRECKMTPEEFNDWYTWDVTDQMYLDAINEKVLVSTEIIDGRMPMRDMIIKAFDVSIHP